MATSSAVEAFPCAPTLLQAGASVSVISPAPSVSDV